VATGVANAVALVPTAFGTPSFTGEAATPTAAPPPDVATASADHGGAGGEQSAVVAPMPGTVIKLLVGAGDSVRARQPLVVLEAMKMETPLTSPYAATVRAVHVAEGDRVAGGAVLVELEE
jgi:glutaconyl-CoA decarboxylase